MLGTTFRFCYALALPLTSFPQYFSCGSFLLTMENPSAIFWCKDSVISAVPLRMRSLPCVAHGELLLMCLRAQLPDRTSFSAHQKECLSLTHNYTFSGTPSLAGGFLLTKKTGRERIPSLCSTLFYLRQRLDAALAAEAEAHPVQVGHIETPVAQGKAETEAFKLPAHLRPAGAFKFRRRMALPATCPARSGRGREHSCPSVPSEAP